MGERSETLCGSHSGGGLVRVLSGEEDFLIWVYSPYPALPRAKLRTPSLPRGWRVGDELLS